MGVLYSCRAADTNQKQFELVKKECQGKKACQIDVSREFFGTEECPDTDDAFMSLWLVYSCDGGGTDRTKSNQPKCEKNDTDVMPTVTPSPPTSNNKCKQYDTGKMNQVDLPGCGGSVEIGCDGGCINIHKVLYSCKEGKSNSEHLKVVKDRCQDQKKCKVAANRETFGEEECPDTDEDSMQLWLIYSCDGGEDLTSIRKPVCNQVINKPTTTTTTTTITTATEPEPEEEKPCRPGTMVGRDVPLDGTGWVKISCSAGCFFLHKVQAACDNPGACLGGCVGNPVHYKLVKKLCKGKSTCEIKPTFAMFGVTGCTAYQKPRLWITHSCPPGSQDFSNASHIFDWNIRQHTTLNPFGK